jgi:hypothetical protein
MALHGSAIVEFLLLLAGGIVCDVACAYAEGAWAAASSVHGVQWRRCMEVLDAKGMACAVGALHGSSSAGTPRAVNYWWRREWRRCVEVLARGVPFSAIANRCYPLDAVVLVVLEVHDGRGLVLVVADLLEPERRAIKQHVVDAVESAD